jgi:hypothetical protein
MRPHLLLTVVVLLLPVLPAHALTMEQVDLPVLARESHLVVAGRVVGTACRFEGTRVRRIVTDVTVAVDRVARGNSVQSVVVTLPGGVVGDEGQYVPGAPRLVPGDEVVLFLGRPEPSPAGLRHHPIALTQGVFHVIREPLAPPRAVQRLGGVSFVPRLAADPDGLDLDLDALLSYVRSVPPAAVAP